MIEVLNVYKSFGVEVLSAVSFCMYPGKITGLIGLNGAGKTTLIRVLAGLYSADKGMVNLAGVKKISLLSAEQGLYKSLKVKMLIEYLGKLQAESFDLLSEEHQFLLKKLQLDKVLDKKVAELSSGWKQKLLLSLSFLNQPDLILLDEPGNYLDFEGQRQLNELLQKYKEIGKYILLATHNLHEAELKCDRIVFINQGRIVFSRDKKELCKDNSLENIVFGLL